MPFSVQAVQAILQQYPPVRRWVVAYSGGLDSHVLLHVLAQLRERLQPAPLQAVHIDHGLHPDSAQWQLHCAQQCQALGVPLQSERVTIEIGTGQSLEALAREQRYQALQRVMMPGDCILNAHHRTDQAETLLLQLLRGAGIAGLAAMPAHTVFGIGWLARPLLNYDRTALLAYARRERLQWLEDPSNSDTGFDRNYLRQHIMPSLRQRWPACDKTIARSAAHCASATQVLGQCAEQWSQQVHGQQRNTLSVSKLASLSVPQQQLTLRHWIAQQGYPTPSQIQLAQIQQQMQAQASATTVIHWAGVELRRYRDDLFLLKPLAAVPVNPIPWDVQAPLEIPDLQIRLVARPALGRGLAVAQLAMASVAIGFRQGGESLRPAGRGCTKTLKQLMQEAGIPPWQRERIPLLFVGKDLASVVGYWQAEQYGVGEAQMGIMIEVQTLCDQQTPIVCK